MRPFRVIFKHRVKSYVNLFQEQENGEFILDSADWHGSELGSSTKPNLQRRSSKVSYATINGVTKALGKPPTGKRKTAPSKSENMEATQTTLHSSNTTSKVNVINDLSWCEQRPYLCPEPDIIVLCYSTIEAESFTEAKTLIWPDLNQRYPGVPVILVATKCDARFDNTAETELEQLWQIDEDSASSTKSKTFSHFFAKPQNQAVAFTFFVPVQLYFFLHNVHDMSQCFEKE